MDNKFHDKPLTLTDADISSQRCVSRRSILSALGLGLGAAAAAVVGSVTGAAQAPTRCTDDDGGRNGDPPGFGAGCRSPRTTRPTGCTDTDDGPNADEPEFGIRCRPRAPSPTGCTDSDSGPNQDQPRFGTRCWI